MVIKKADIKRFLLDTKIREVMVSPVITVKETDDFVLVQEKITLYDVRHLPVVNETGNLVGLITQRDLYQIHSPRRLEDGSWFYDKEALNQFLLSRVMLLNPFHLKTLIIPYMRPLRRLYVSNLAVFPLWMIIKYPVASSPAIQSLSFL